MLEKNSINDAPPLSNTGGTSQGALSLYRDKNSGNFFRVPSEALVSPNTSDFEFIREFEAPSGSAFLDTISFTFNRSDFYKAFPESIENGFYYESLDEYVDTLSEWLEEIFGFGVTKQNKNGRNFYEFSYCLGFGYGFLAIGGENQKGTAQIYIGGQGLMAASEGWERRLYLFGVAINGKITRSDLASDSFDGEYTVEQAKNDHESGLFKHKNAPRNPAGSQAGCWNFKELGLQNKGRTYYVGGGKGSGKLFRIYEKGLQLLQGAKDSEFFKSLMNWTRVEVQLTSVNRVIPWEVLLRPQDFLAGSASALEFISEKQSRIKVIANTIKAKVDNSFDNIKKQYGRILYLLFHSQCSDENGDLIQEKSIKLLKSLFVTEFPQSVCFGKTQKENFEIIKAALDTA